MYVRYIPRALLIHSVTHGYNKTVDEWDNIIYANSQAINRVRVEPSTSLKMDKDNKQVQLNALMFYCPKTSTPQDIGFKLDEQITFNNRNYTIVNIELLYDNNKLHHIELGLI